MLVLVFITLQCLYFSEKSRSCGKKTPFQIVFQGRLINYGVQHKRQLLIKISTSRENFLTILLDERNATAYNRLGIIYAGQKKFDDVIECFEIAQSLESSAQAFTMLD